MTGALLILGSLVLVGALLYFTDVKYFRHHHDLREEKEETPENNSKQEEVCCGLHLVCEKTSLAVTSDEVLYYDDEELDRFAGRLPESYSPEEAEEFRDILLTLLSGDIAGWARSLSLRKIELPPDVKDELFMLVSELRAETLTLRRSS